MQYIEVARFDSLDDFAGAADALDAAHFAEFDRGLVAIALPVDAAGWVGPVQAALNVGPDIHLWAPVYNDGNTIYIPFEKRPPQLAAIAGIIGALSLAVLVGVLVISIFKVQQAADELAGPFGTLLAAGAALVVVPTLLRDSGELLRRNPQRNPVDTTGLVQLAGLGIVGAVGYQAGKQGQLPGFLQNFLHELFPDYFPAASGGGNGGGNPPPRPAPPTPPVGGPGPNPGPPPEGCQWARTMPSGRSYLEFGVSPPNPDRQEGAMVRYTGRLRIWSDHDGWVGAQNAVVEFWDPDACVPFQSITTTPGGYYETERPLQSDELNGYRVFAFFRADGDYNGQDQTNSGIWNVVPQ